MTFLLLSVCINILTDVNNTLNIVLVFVIGNCSICFGLNIVVMIIVIRYCYCVLLSQYQLLIWIAYIYSFSIYLQTEYTITCYVTMGEGTYMDKWMDRLYY